MPRFSFALSIECSRAKVNELRREGDEKILLMGAISQVI